MVKKFKLAFVIPTKGRYKDLEILLDSIENQTSKADLIIIVDANREYSENKLKNYRFPIKYIHTGPNSLTEARNIGVRNVPENFDLVGFLDDDIVLEKRALEAMFSYWEKAPADLGGAVFNIINDKLPSSAVWLKLLFLTGRRERGVVLRSGFHTMICPIKRTKYVQWLFGGATIWRREVLGDFRFDEWFAGYGFGEDLDFSYRVGRKYKLVAVAEAKVRHLITPINKRKNYPFGVMQVVSRFYFVKKNPNLSVTLCSRACVGQFLENLVRGTTGLNAGYIIRALGNSVGFIRVAMGKV